MHTSVRLPIHVVAYPKLLLVRGHSNNHEDDCNEASFFRLAVRVLRELTEVVSRLSFVDCADTHILYVVCSPKGPSLAKTDVMRCWSERRCSWCMFAVAKPS